MNKTNPSPDRTDGAEHKHQRQDSDRAHQAHPGYQAHHGHHEHHGHQGSAELSSAPASVQEAPPGTDTIYTCPMHPEIRQPAPGNCPICGMALEPLMPALEEEENPELRD